MCFGYKGEQNLFIEAETDSLTQLLEIAKIQSVEASNKIEGIYTSDEGLKKLVLDKTIHKINEIDDKSVSYESNPLDVIHFIRK